ncbi:MAG: Gfo/Idh/MocA family oxidoreductase [Phycisphaeraceae bacterium]|nr:Gfo/Idh/MocA family oxidoreductase [Phycisphaeraceae bacterium]
MKPVVTGLVGLGGYAANICRLLLEERGQAAPSGDGTVQLAAVVSSNRQKHAERIAELEAHGVKVCDSYEQMLALPELEAVWIPLPIDMHLGYSRLAMEAGKHVMLEKPVAGAVQDVDELIALRDRHQKVLLIGYQDIYDPATVEVKRRLLDGAIGSIRRATLWAVWPREHRYYHRNDWAGAIKKDGQWVMDSPANNALAHFINIGLFFMGTGMLDSAAPAAVEAELYRANPIENFDTCSLRITLADGTPMLVHLTHAGQELQHPTLMLEGEAGRLSWSFGGQIDLRITSDTGKPDMAYSTQRDERPHRFMADRFNQLIRGIDDPRVAVSTLENARVQTLVVNAASEAAAVRTVPESAIRTEGEGEMALRVINGIEDGFAWCNENEKMLHESGRFDWTVPAEKMSLQGYKSFSGPKKG